MQPQEPKEPLPYEPRPEGPPRRLAAAGWQFWLGLAAGSAVSLVIWWWGWERFSSINAIIAAILVKAAAGSILAAVPRVRSIGAGVLVSIAVGALIFFSVCGSR